MCARALIRQLLGDGYLQAMNINLYAKIGSEAMILLICWQKPPLIAYKAIVASKGFNINMPASAFRSFRYCGTSSRILALILACRETTQWGSMKMMTGPSAHTHHQTTQTRQETGSFELKSTPLCIQNGVSAICSCKARLDNCGVSISMVYGCTSVTEWKGNRQPWKQVPHPQGFGVNCVKHCHGLCLFSRQWSGLNHGVKQLKPGSVSSRSSAVYCCLAEIAGRRLKSQHLHRTISTRSESKHHPGGRWVQ